MSTNNIGMRGAPSIIHPSYYQQKDNDSGDGAEHKVNSQDVGEFGRIEYLSHQNQTNVHDITDLESVDDSDLNSTRASEQGTDEQKTYTHSGDWHRDSSFAVRKGSHSIPDDFDAYTDQNIGEEAIEEKPNFKVAARKTAAGLGEMAQATKYHAKTQASSGWERLKALATKVRKIGRDPLKDIPPSLRQDADFMESVERYIDVRREAKQATVTGYTAAAKGIGSSISKGVLATSIGAAVGAGLTHLIALLSAKKVSSEADISSNDVNTFADLPDLNLEEPGFRDLAQHDPELAEALQGIFSPLYPDGNLNASKQEMGPAKDLADDLVKEFKELYNSIPSSERAEAVLRFAEGTSTVITELKSKYGEYGELSLTNGYSVWLKPDYVDEPIRGLIKEIDDSFQEKTPQIAHSSNNQRILQEEVSTVPTAATFMGAIFGGAIGGGVLLAMVSRGKVSLFNREELREKWSDMKAKKKVANEMFANDIKPQLQE